VFTELVESFGVKGAQFEELYALEFDQSRPVYGLIFLFNWRNDIKDDRETCEAPGLFFANQVVRRTCAANLGGGGGTELEGSRIAEVSLGSLSPPPFSSFQQFLPLGDWVAVHQSPTPTNPICGGAGRRLDGEVATRRKGGRCEGRK
jgi:hypothetical protein